MLPGGRAHTGPVGRHTASSTPLRRCLLRGAASGAAALVVCMATAGPAEAAAQKVPKPPRVQKVLDYLKLHPLEVTSQFMQYDASPSTTLPDCIAGLTPDDALPPPAARGRHSSGFGDSSSTAEGSGSSSSAQSDSERRRAHYGRVIAGLLHAATGGLDQAHNLVTPLCWGSPTPYAGPPISGSPAARDAAYVHALVHRQEGSCDGEFGSGFSNANYWYRAAGAATHPIAAALSAEARKAAAGDTELERQAGLIFSGSAAGSGSGSGGAAWSPDRFVSLCARASEAKDPKLLAFCRAVMGAEVNLLLDHCYLAAADT